MKRKNQLWPTEINATAKGSGESNDIKVLIGDNDNLTQFLTEEYLGT